MRKPKFKTPYKQGHFHPKNKEKYKGKYPLMYRSSYEYKFCMYCDRNSSVVQWGLESVVIPYYDRVSKKKRRYFIDFNITIKDKNGTLNKYLVEIKPYKETIIPQKGRKSDKSFLYESLTYAKNCCKWEAAQAYAKKHGSKFIILTENELMID